MSKYFLVLLTTIVLISIYLIKSIFNRKFTLILTPLTLPLIGFGTGALLSTLLSQRYNFTSLIGLGGIYIAFSLIAVFFGYLLPKKSHFLLNVLVASSSLLVISSLLEILGIGPAKILNNVLQTNFPTNLVFNISGSPLVAFQLLTIALVAIIAYALRNKQIGIFHLVSLPVIVFGLLMYGYSMLPGKPAHFNILPYSTSWDIIRYSLNNVKSILIGWGPESFINIYRNLKPASVNYTTFWNFDFSGGSNMLCTLIPTIGIIGSISWILIVIKFLMELRRSKVRKNPLTWIILTCFAFQLIMPFNIIVLIIQAIAIAYWAKDLSSIYEEIEFENLAFQIGKHNKNKDSSKFQQILTSKMLVMGVSLIGIIALIPITWLISKSILSHYFVYQSNQLASQNEIVKAYEVNNKAIKYSPYIAEFRNRHAIMSTQIAIALSNKENPSEKEKLLINRLVKQAVKEANIATNLEPLNSQYWLILANIYSQLIGLVEGADQQTISTYVKAVETNPTNPLVRVEIGNLFTQFKNYNQAISFYNQAINLKSDLPLAYYQLGKAYALNSQLDQAKNTWLTALDLLPDGSEDQQILLEQLEELNKIIEKAKEGQESNQDTTSQIQQTGPAIEEEEMPSNVNNELEVESNNIEELTPEEIDQLSNTETNNDSIDTELDLTDVVIENEASESTESSD